MNTVANSTLVTVTVSNLIGVILMLMVFMTNRGKFFKDRYMKFPFRMSLIAIITCFADIASFYLDGKPGAISTVLLMLLNSWLFMANITMSYLWMKYLCNRIGAHVSSAWKKTCLGINASALLLIMLNFFFPILFSIEGNVYRREGLFWVFLAICGFYIVSGLYIYYVMKGRGGVLISFPVGIFIVPVGIGIVVQMMFYGISVIWVGVAIGIVGLVSSLKNELIYIDQLTGVYNRFYLEKIKAEVVRNSTEMTGIMVDLNNFKSINDRYGHKAGDEALTATADILSKAAEDRGKVIRYAGDEFVLIINSTDRKITDRIKDNITLGFSRYNSTNRLNYTLSAAMGSHVFDMKTQSIDEFMNTIDSRMYANKELYYLTHTR